MQMARGIVCTYIYHTEGPMIGLPLKNNISSIEEEEEEEEKEPSSSRTKRLECTSSDAGWQ